MPKQQTMRLITKENLVPHVERFARIGNIGAYVGDGFMRLAWTAAESTAFEYLRHDAEEAGFQTRYDAVGNLFIRLPGEWDDIVLTGSHIDSVAEGGMYDGVAGVLTGLEAMKAIQASGVPLRKGIELVLWRGEESASFGQPYKGSKAAFGQLDPQFLQNILGEHLPLPNNTMTLEDAIRSQQNPLTQESFDPSCIKKGVPTLSQQDVDSIAAFVELHIEQANKLETDNDDIGIVTSIRGPSRCAATLEHGSDHDGLLAQLLVELDRLAHKAMADGLDLVQTFALVNLQHVPAGSTLHNCGKTKVPGYAEVRLNKASDEFQELIEIVAREFQVEFGVENIEEGCLLTIKGAFDHSGATPMGVPYRHDANLAAVHFIVRACEGDTSLKATINCPDPGRGSFLMDVRSNNRQGRDAYVANVVNTIEHFAQQHRITVKPPEVDYLPPVEHLDQDIQRAIEHACQTLNYRYQSLTSGAGHDAVIVARQRHSDGRPIPVGMIFIPCKDGRSHSKEEFTSLDALTKGANVLAHTLYLLAR